MTTSFHHDGSQSSSIPCATSPTGLTAKTNPPGQALLDQAGGEPDADGITHEASNCQRSLFADIESSPLSLEHSAGASIRLSQARHLVIRQPGLRSLDLEDCPLLEDVDLSHLQGELHLTVRGCPRLRRIVVPGVQAGGAAHVHIEASAPLPALLEVDGGLRQLDVRWTGGHRFLQRCGRSPWSGALVASGPAPAQQELGRDFLQEGLLVWHATQPEEQQALGHPELAVRDILVLAADAGLHVLEYLGTLRLKTFTVQNAPGLMVLRLRTTVTHLRLTGCDLLRAVTSEDHRASVVSVLNSCAGLDEGAHRPHSSLPIRPRSFLAIDVPCELLNLTRVSVQRVRVFHGCPFLRVNHCSPTLVLKVDPMTEVRVQGFLVRTSRQEAIAESLPAKPLTLPDESRKGAEAAHAPQQCAQVQGEVGATTGDAQVLAGPLPQPTQTLHAVALGPATEYLDLCRQWVRKILLDKGGYEKVLHPAHCSDPEMVVFAGIPTEALTREKYDGPSLLGKLWQLRESFKGDAATWPTSGAGAANLSWLRIRLGLTELQTQIVGFCALSEVNQSLRRALASLGSVDHLQQVQVLGVLLGASTGEVEQALGPSESLVGSCLMEVDRRTEDLLHLNVRLVPGLAEKLFAEAQPGFEDIFRTSFSRDELQRQAAAAFAHLQPQLGHALAYLRDCIAHGRAGTNLLIRGAPEAGKSSLARLIAQELGVEVFQIALPQGSSPRNRAKLRLNAYRMAQRVLADRPQSLIVFDGIEDLDDAVASPTDDSSSSQGKLSVREQEALITTNPVPAIWVSARVRHLDPSVRRAFGFHLHLDVIPESVRSQITRAQTNSLGLTTQWLETKALNPAVSPQLMSRASATAQAILRQDPSAKPEAVMDSLLEASLKTLGETRHAGWQHGPMTFDAALVSAKVDIPEIVERLRVSPAARLVFFGPPGTGKSELARHIARAIGRPALIKKSSDLISAFVGESERAVADTFEEARRTGAVLILDEADSFFQRREGDARRYEISLVNEFLQQLDAFDQGTLVATTNAVDRMDQASLRRFDLKLEFTFLPAGGMQVMELMGRCCKQLGVYEAGCEKLAISLQKLAPGDFAAVIRQARFRPVASAEEVLKRLQEEVSFKDGPRQAIGFAMAH